MAEKFEIGKFYSHGSGRQVAVLGEVDSTKWGKMLVLEEADKSGHAISCAEINEFADIVKLGWVEIGKEEWMRNFDDVTCEACGKVFQKGEKFVPTDKGPIHMTCFSQMMKERGSSIVKPNIASIH